MRIRHMGLFEGIGGFSLAARWAGWQTPVMVEWSTYCQAVLKKNFPDATIFGDIRQFDGRPYAGQVDIITGGFPCQPYSTAGKRKGNDDDRALWPEMLRVIQEVAPTWVIGENVAGILSMDGGRVFAGILADLENAGYSTEIYIIPAIAVGAPHRRDRVWIVAHSNTRHCAIPIQSQCGRHENKGTYTDRKNKRLAPDADNDKIERQRRNGREILRIQEAGGCGAGRWQEHWYEAATRICGMDDGFSAGLDGTREIPENKNTGKASRLEALGNAIVPHIAFQIFDAINQYHAYNI